MSSPFTVPKNKRTWEEPGFLFLSMKSTLFQIVFSILFRVSNHQIVDKENLTEFVF